MRTAEEILKKNVTHEFETRNDNYEIGRIINAMKEYAKEVAKEALKNASENVKLTISEFSKRKDGSTGWNEVTLKDNLYIINDGCNIVANKQSILNESNIPTL